MLPKSKEHLEKLNKYVEQSVQLLNEKDLLTEDLKNVEEIVKEEFQIKPAEYKVLVKVRYDKNKVESNVEAFQKALSDDALLKG